MYGIQVDQDISCRTVGRCTFGVHLDREIMDLVPRHTLEEMTMEQRYAAPVMPLAKNLGRHFLYVRYNADLSGGGLENLGFPEVDPTSIQKMDSVVNIPVLLQIGRAAAQQVDIQHFGSFMKR